jgi:CubicO group peptidase (beta-lactamase class C family)
MAMKKHILTFLLLVAGFGVQAQPTGTCGAPTDMADGWTAAKPDDVGLDGARLCDLDAFLKPWPNANIHALVVARRGKLVLEHYRMGKDVRFNAEDRGVVRFTPIEKHDVRSISKSVTELLVGIALAEGRYPALDSAVIDFFPECPMA